VQPYTIPNLGVVSLWDKVLAVFGGIESWGLDSSLHGRYFEFPEKLDTIHLWERDSWWVVWNSMFPKVGLCANPCWWIGVFVHRESIYGVCILGYPPFKWPARHILASWKGFLPASEVHVPCQLPMLAGVGAKPCLAKYKQGCHTRQKQPLVQFLTLGSVVTTWWCGGKTNQAHKT
jgi:hypothetical protein